MGIRSYSDAMDRLGNRSRRKLENNTYLVAFANAIAVRLHSTNVVIYYPDGRIRLDNGGWKTVTTKDRINSYSPFSVYQMDYNWYFACGKDYQNGTYRNVEEMPILVTD